MGSFKKIAIINSFIILILYIEKRNNKQYAKILAVSHTKIFFYITTEELEERMTV